MAPVSSGGRSLRTRCTEDKRPLGQLSNKIRGSRAAKEYVDGTLSAAEAQSKYLVTAETFSYWKNKVENSEYPALLEAERAAQQAREVAATPQSRKKEPPLDKADEREKYCQAYIHAGKRTAHVGKRRAAAEATQKFGIKISDSTAFRASEKPGQRPEKRGRQLILGADLESKLEDFCILLRDMNLPIYRDSILDYVNRLIEGTPQQELFKHKEVRKDWYYHFLKRSSKLTTSNIRPLEAKRAEWTTAANTKMHCDMLRDLMIQHKIAVENPSHNPHDKNSQEVIIVKPCRLVSMDETRLTNDSTDHTKAKNCRSIVGKRDDDCAVIVNKGGGDATAIGGSTADGYDLPLFAIFANDIIHLDDVEPHKLPTCRRPDPTNPAKTLPCAFLTNKKGGVTDDLGINTSRAAWNRRCRGCRKMTRPSSSWMVTARTSPSSCLRTAGRSVSTFCSAHLTPRTFYKARMWSTLPYSRGNIRKPSR